MEEAAVPLKKIHRALNEYLQCAYFVHKTDAAYGFILSPKNNSAQRNIIRERMHLDQHSAPVGPNS